MKSLRILASPSLKLFSEPRDLLPPLGLGRERIECRCTAQNFLQDLEGMPAELDIASLQSVDEGGDGLASDAS